jgi:hypothetical protein
LTDDFAIALAALLLLGAGDMASVYAAVPGVIDNGPLPPSAGRRKPG